MKLEPVYLVAPDPPPQAGTSRRSFVVALLCGGLAGFAGGRWAFHGGAKRADPAPAKDARELLWALDLQSGHLAQLVAEHETFLWVVAAHADRRLDAGVEALALAVLEDAPEVGDRRATLATSIAMTIEGFGRDHPLSRLLPALHAAAKR